VRRSLAPGNERENGRENRGWCWSCPEIPDPDQNQRVQRMPSGVAARTLHRLIFITF